MKGVLTTAVAAVLWGTSFPATKWALPFFGDALFFGAVRLAFATLLALILLWTLGRLNWSIYKNPLIWALGFTNAIGIALQNYGLEMTTASKTVLLVDINVVIVAILSFWLFKEKFGVRKVGGVIAGILGVFFLAYNSELALQQEQLLGDIFVFLSGCSYALFIVIMKKVVKDSEPLEASVAAIATSTIFLMIPSSIMIPTGMMDARIDIEGILPMLYLGLVCTTVAYYLWAFGLKRLSATASSIILLLEVLTGMLLSILLLQEIMTSMTIVGAIFIIMAIVLASEIDFKNRNAKNSKRYQKS
ncbi:MAG: DMT family transporter [Thermoplasmata archaeon]|nr:DMT family transporter [Thermoplasmata archaeon]